jgi:type I restriction enzyme S subunit
MVKDGYKQTDIGVIPKDWKLKEIGEICQIFGRIGFRGYTVNDIVTENKGVITISPSNIINNATNFNKCTYISWFKYEESPEIKIFNGDILLVKTGSTVGKTAIVKNLKREATINPQIVVLKKINIDNFYLGYLVGYKDFQNNIARTIVGGAIPTLSQKQIASYKIPIPPKEEQKAIAKALSDTDELISSLEKLISKKEAIKQGTMQQLLTGKKRLSGFGGEWEEKRLGDIFEITAGGDLKKDLYSENLDEKYRYPIYANSVFNKGLYGYSTFSNIEKESVTVTARGNLGVAFHRTNAYVAIGRLLILQQKLKVNSLFCAESINLTLDFANESTSVPQLTAPQISKYEIKLPPTTEEQNAIAQILSDMDNEIETLKQKLSKTKAIKDGIMSELLTGKTRLKVKDE